MKTFDELYPPEKTEQTMKVLRDMWLGKRKTVYSANADKPFYRQLQDEQDMIDRAAENILLNAGLPGFNIPRFMADFGTVSTAAYWGGERYRSSNGNPVIKPVINTADEADRVYPGSPEGGDAAKAVDIWRAVSDRLGTDRLYCSFIDIQGPLNTASLLWDQTDFMVSMITEPSKVHKLLEQVTDQLIGIMKGMIKNTGMISGPIWPYFWLPPDIGVAVTEDYMPLISPELYKEFGIPYLEKMNDAFGGLFIHCCGNYEHQIDNLIKARINLLGLELHYPYMRPETLFKAFGSSVLFVPFIGPHGHEEFSSVLDFMMYVENMRLPETRIWYTLFDSDPTFHRQVQFAEYLLD